MGTTQKKELFYCKRCKRTMRDDQFYSSNNKEKYPDGKLDTCKKCITAHVDNWNPDTYLWILQEADVPYVPDQWNNLLAKYATKDANVTGTTILGRYLSAMKMSQYQKYRWKDTEHLQDVANKRIEETMTRQGYDQAEIDNVINQATFLIPKEPLKEPAEVPSQESDVPEQDYFDRENGFAEDDLAVDLTKEDKIYLRLKWGKGYHPDEWVTLEKFYNEMMEAYDIQTPSHIDTLKHICKASLRAHQAIDIGDIDGYQKITRVYDQLMKSGNFTAVQNKAESGDAIDCVSKLVAICEEDGFIPRYYTDGPQDKVDYVIQDMQDYTYNLVAEEMHMGELIDRAVKQIEEDKLHEAEQELDEETEEEAMERELFAKDDSTLTDEDFKEFSNFQEHEHDELEDMFDRLEDNR